MLAEIGLAVEVLKVVVPVLVELAKSFNIWPSSIESLGEKALCAETEGIRLEDFESYEDYMKYLEGYEVNPDTALEFSEEAKTEKGIELLITGLVKEIGSAALDAIIILVKTSPEFYIANRILTYMEVFNERGIGIEKVVEYMERGLTLSDAKEILECIIEAERRMDSKLSDQEIRDKIEMQRTPI